MRSSETKVTLMRRPVLFAWIDCFGSILQLNSASSLDLEVSEVPLALGAFPLSLNIFPIPLCRSGFTQDCKAVILYCSCP